MKPLPLYGFIQTIAALHKKTTVQNYFQKNCSLSQLLSIIFIVVSGLAACSKSENTATNIPDPVVTGVMPASGKKNTTVTINGTHFGTDISKIKVYFNGVSAGVTHVYDGAIICTVPPNAGSGIIKVKFSNGKEITGPVFIYKYNVTVTTVAGGTNGYADGTGAAAQFGESYGLCNDAFGNVIMVDYFNSKVRKVTPLGEVTTIAGTGPGYADGAGAAAQFVGPQGICSDGIGNFYIADTYMIRKMTQDGVVTTIAGSYTNNGNADGFGTSARFNGVRGICIDGNGNLYVADVINNLVRKILPTGFVTTLAGSPAGYTGTTDGSGSSARFSGPSGICIDADGVIYVSDVMNHRIRKISAGGEVVTFAGSSAGSADGIGTEAQFYYPSGMCIDKSGNVFVADGGNNTIRMITPSGVVSTIASDSPLPDFFSPNGICFDGDKSFYVMDTYNYRIRKLVIE